MTYTDEQVNLVINKLSKSQYEAMKQAGTLNANELYITDDDMEVPTRTSELVNDSGFITKNNVNQTSSNVAFQMPSNIGIVAMDTNGANMTSVTPMGVAYTKDGMGLVVQPPSGETGSKTLATREWVGSQTITMSGTYDDDTEFSFNIKGSN